jgi:hypothetical protein
LRTFEEAVMAAARGDADERQSALAAEHATDWATMRRVADSLRSRMAGVDPLSRHDELGLPLEERRTVTSLLHTRGAL